MLTEVEAQKHIEREQRNNDALLMRSMDKNLGVKRYIPTDIMLEINLRIVQYNAMFKAFSLESLALQTINDFRIYIIPLQNKKLDVTKPIGILRSNNKKIFVNQNIKRQDFGVGGVEYFMKEK